MRNPSLLHFLSYAWKDVSLKAFALFTLIAYGAFVPGLFLVDHYNRSTSAGQTTVVMSIVLGALWAIIIIYNLVQYKRYVRNRLW